MHAAFVRAPKDHTLFASFEASSFLASLFVPNVELLIPWWLENEGLETRLEASGFWASLSGLYAKVG